MLRRPFSVCRFGVLCALATVLAGCSIDRVEWESTGFVVDEARHALEEEHHAVDPAVQCIQREVQGAVWECRGHAGSEEYECTVHVDIHHEIHKLHCEREHEEDAPDEEEASGGEDSSDH
jgi:hypothetical protein